METYQAYLKRREIFDLQIRIKRQNEKNEEGGRHIKMLKLKIKKLEGDKTIWAKPLTRNCFVSLADTAIKGLTLTIAYNTMIGIIV